LGHGGVLAFISNPILPSCAPLEVPWGKGNGLRVIGYYGVKVTVDLLPQKRWRQS
jgi:hypothetical protein